MLETGVSDDDTGAYHHGGEGEINWRNLDEAGLAHQAEIDAAVASVRAELHPLSRARESATRAGARAG